MLLPHIRTVRVTELLKKQICVHKTRPDGAGALYPRFSCSPCRDTAAHPMPHPLTGTQGREPSFSQKRPGVTDPHTTKG